MANKLLAKPVDDAPQRNYSLRASFTLLWQLVRPYKVLMVATLLTLCFDIVGMLLVPTELANLLNSVTSGEGMDAVWRHAAIMLAASLLGSGGCIVSYHMASKLAANVGRDMRMTIYRHSLAFSGADFNRFGTGSMITRTMSDANVVQQTLLMSFVMMSPVPLTCIVSLILTFSLDATMGYAVLAVTVACLLISAIAVAKSAPIFLIMQSFIDRMNVRLREAITGVRVIRAFGKDEYEQGRLDSDFEAYAARAIRVNLVFAVTDTMTFFFANAVESLIFLIGADRVGVHAMQVGSITAVIQYAMFIMFFMMMAQFALLQVPRALACLTRAKEVLDYKPSIADKPGVGEKDAAAGGDLGGEKPAPRAAGAPVASFEHMSFRFDDADENTLGDLNFTLRRGQTTAIIGNTGSGKSTIAKMLLRFLDASEGRVCLGGQDVRDITQDELRSHIAYVPQKAWLFSGTIAQNLRYGAADADDERLWHAVDVAQGAFVHELDDGLETRVAQGGTNFSGGQRQRLSIARALVRRADLYIFDDSFSALDYKTDAALRAALKDELADAAVLIIAQRVSTIQHADQIVVLGDGRVEGMGTHEELLANCPAYLAIYESQVKGGVDNG